MKNILILFGGNSFEHDISIKSVNFILDNIDRDKYNFTLVGIDKSNNWYIVNNYNVIDSSWKDKDIEKVDNIFEFIKKFDKVFPMIHGNSCEDGKLQSLFELCNIDYVGSSSFSSLISYDKYLTKLVVDKYDIEQVLYIKYDDEMDLSNISYPVIVKPCKSGSSIGINVANSYDELIKYVNIAKIYDDDIIIEKYIENRRELECAILEKDNELIVSDIGEIKVDGWYDFDSKYKNYTDTFISDISDDIKNKIKEYSIKIFKVLKCKDYSRIDFLYDVDENKLYFNEINTIPGFTSISMYPKLIENIGINSKELINILISF